MFFLSFSYPSLKKNVVLTSARGIHGPRMSEFVFLLMLSLNRNFPQYWFDNGFNPDIDSFGVDFVLVVDHYQKSLRSAKFVKS